MTIKDIKLNNIGLWALLLFTALCPIFYDTANVRGTQTLRLGQEQFFQLGATVLFTIAFLENIYLALFFLWVITLYCYFNFPAMAGNYIINIFWGLLLYQITYKLVNHENVKKVFKVIMWLAVLNMIWIAFQFLNIDPIFMSISNKVYTHDFVGLMGLKAFMGIFFALAIPIVCYFRIWLAIPLFLPIYLSDCSVAMVGGITAFLFAIWFKSRTICVSLLVILGILGSLYVIRDTQHSEEMFKQRFSLWGVSIKDSFKHPITGWGPDSFMNVGAFKPFMYFCNPRTNESKAISIEALRIGKQTGKFPPMDGFLKEGDSINPWSHPHNEYISVLFELGLIGFAILLLLLYDMAKRFYENDYLIALAGYFIAILIVSTGQFPFHVARIGCHVMVFLAIYYKLTDEVKNIEQKGVSYGT